jgi:hypothetical protein
MGQHLVRRDDAADIRFDGEQLARVNNHSHDGQRSNRWLVLELYRTAGGSLVCQRIGRTIWQGERDRYEGAVCVADEARSAERQVIDFFGYSDLAKELYSAAGLDAEETIE